MPNPTDLILLPLARSEESSEAVFFPASGLFLPVPARRPARGREKDRLFVHLTFSGNASLEAGEMLQLLERSAEEYYRTQGTVTSALRAMLQPVNQGLLDRNLRNAGRSLQAIGLLTVGVLRPDRLVLAQSGPTTAVLASDAENVLYQDSQLAGRGLGISRTPIIRFLQFSLQPNDLLLISANPSPAWQPNWLRQHSAIGLESLRRLLLQQVQVDAQAVLIQAREGEGKLRIARARSPEMDAPPIESAPAEPLTRHSPPPVDETEQPEAALSEEIPATVVEDQVLPALDEPDLPEAPLDIEEDEEQTIAQAPAPVMPAPRRSIDPAIPERMPATAPLPAQAASAEQQPIQQPAEQPAPARPPRANRRAMRQAAAGGALTILQAFEGFFSQLRQSLRNLTARVLPEESMINIPPGVMAFIAIAVPVLVTAIAGTVYVQRGLGAEYLAKLSDAQAAVQFASQQSDPNAQRQAWAAASVAVESVEELRASTETAALRLDIRNAIDLLDGVERYSFQPALIGGLSSQMNVTRLLPVGEELYLLDGISGTVLRARNTAQGYEIDSAFRCTASTAMSTVIDIAALRITPGAGADILAVDRLGNLMICTPGNAPVYDILPAPPLNWGEPAAISVRDGDLYLLDPRTNAVWIYEQDDQGRFISLPVSYFEINEAPFLEDAIDLTALASAEISILHSDGRLTICTDILIEGVQTRCQDPATYQDGRPGRGNAAIIPGTQFSQMQYTTPPEPSLYLLDDRSGGVAHFSLALRLQRMIEPVDEWDEDEQVTAFAVGQNRRIFLAAGSRVVYAVLP